ncbi:hypothetical protein [Arthrobacter sp. MMS18-M83]|uniref:hypothetical protein n=1 Tax=Arthrobacter sp. MMS18-M83 TaxID=2996261 RepID=UPI00227C66A2|nr:hypothetical protein [Arthrobacter sp. MMS18-M83]WAH97604.1 hypothetical protein OW521_01505 [Arthrobacter sp. MMS18-M83]
MPTVIGLSPGETLVACVEDGLLPCGDVGGEGLLVPLMATVADRRGRSCLTTLAIASPVLFWTERETAKVVNTMVLQQLAGALEQHSELACVCAEPTCSTIRWRSTLEHLHQCVNKHPSEHIAAGQKAVSSRVATA